LKKTTTLIICLLTGVTFFGQSNKIIDSLYFVLRTSTKDSEKAAAHNRLSWMFINNDIPTAKAHIDSSYILYTKIEDEKGIALCNYKYGVLYRVSGNYKESLKYIDKYQSYIESQEDSIGIANILYQKGVVLSLQGNYESSLKEYYKVLSIYESLKDSTSMGFTLNSIGIVYKNLKKYPQAIENSLKAQAIHEKLNDLNNLANVYNSLGSIYAEQLKYDQALDYFNKTLAIDIQNENNWGIAFNHRDIGTLLVEKGEYEKALTHLNKAYKIQVKYDFEAEMAETLAKISSVYLELGDYNKSHIYLKKGFQHITSSKKVFRDLHFQSYKLYDKIGDPKQALYHHKKYMTYKDSIFNDENIKNINTLEIQFETQKKDNEIIKQQLQIEQNKNDLQKRKTQYNYMTGSTIFLLIASILGWFIFQQRQKRKNQEIVTLKREHQIKTLESLMEGEEKERFRIAKELHDGVNGDLSAIKFKLSTLLEMNNKVIKEAIVMIDDSCKQVRAISHNLVPPSLEGFNLLETTQDYCNNLDAVHPIKILFQHIGIADPLAKNAEINIFRIIQELVTNSIKHSGANEINVQISNRKDTVQITVEDNGKGFDRNAVNAQGIGLNNIDSRVDYLQATLDLISNEQGTSYTIEIDKNKLNDN
jgi:two-component system, NarL family, sensor kinase